MTNLHKVYESLKYRENPSRNLIIVFIIVNCFVVHERLIIFIAELFKPIPHILEHVRHEIVHRIYRTRQYGVSYVDELIIGRILNEH